MLRPSRATPSSRYSPYGGGAAHVVEEEEESDQAMLDSLLAGVDPGPGRQPAGGAGDICQFFAKAGWCKWGDGCRYRHEAPDGAAPPVTAELCQFFSKAGWCQWRENCKYIHALPTAATGMVNDPAMLGLPAPGGKGFGEGFGKSFGKGKGGPPSVICEFFTKAGWCKWGEGCRYIHAGAALPAAEPRPAKAGARRELHELESLMSMLREELLGSGPEAARPAPIASLPRSMPEGTAPMCKYFASPGGCKNGELCPFQHVGEPGEPEVCQFFQRAGWCKWNDQCKYVHAGGPDLPLALPMAASGSACQFFQKAGWCKWGDGCRFLHEGGPPLEGRGRPGPGTVNEICQFFAKSGWCKWADGCKYIHAMEPGILALQDDEGLEPLPGEEEVFEGNLEGVP